jgi:hypothetical protein
MFVVVRSHYRDRILGVRSAKGIEIHREKHSRGAPATSFAPDMGSPREKFHNGKPVVSTGWYRGELFCTKSTQPTMFRS